MPLIKNANADSHTRSAVVLDLGDLRRQADAILADARAEARRICEDAEHEAQQLIDGAAERGHADGFQRGLAEGREQGVREGREETKEAFGERIEALVNAWSDALDRWHEKRAAMLLAAREDVLAFAFELARKVVLRQIEIDPLIVRDQLAESLALLSRPSRVRISLHPEDRPLVEEIMPAVTAKYAEIEHAELRDDPDVQRGGCVVATERGVIDATIDRQLERIARTILPSGTDDRGDGESDADAESQR
jgi:flagellar assembly protein FliH